MRTPALKNLDSTISKLNTHFALSNLFAEQFFLANSTQMNKSPMMLATDAFKGSEAAKRINIPLGKLQKQVDEFETFLLSQSIARCSEASKSYFEWIELFSVKTLDCVRDKKTNDDGFFDSLAIQIGVVSKTKLAPRECFDSLDHVRLRRNSLVHNDEESTKAYSTICRNHGTSLNRYWSERLARDCRIDFSNSNPTDLDGDAFIDLIHTVRLSIESFDKNYCKLIPYAKLHEYIIDQFDRHVDCAKIDGERRKKKLEQFALRLFDVQLTNGCVA